MAIFKPKDLFLSPIKPINAGNVSLRSTASNDASNDINRQKEEFGDDTHVLVVHVSDNFNWSYGHSRQVFPTTLSANVPSLLDEDEGKDKMVDELMEMIMSRAAASSNVHKFNITCKPELIPPHKDPYIVSSNIADKIITGNEHLRLASPIHDNCKGWKWWAHDLNLLLTQILKSPSKPIDDNPTGWYDRIMLCLPVTTVNGSLLREKLLVWSQVVLGELGLKAVSFVPAPVSVVFASALANAIVVELGHQMVSVSVVLDGTITWAASSNLIHHLPRILLKCLRHQGWPISIDPKGDNDLITEADLFSNVDDTNTNGLSKYLTLDSQESSLSPLVEVYLRRSGQNSTKKYSLKLGSERYWVPYSLLFSDSLYDSNQLLDAFESEYDDDSRNDSSFFQGHPFYFDYSLNHSSTLPPNIKQELDSSLSIKRLKYLDEMLMEATIKYPMVPIVITGHYQFKGLQQQLLQRIPGIHFMNIADDDNISRQLAWKGAAIYARIQTGGGGEQLGYSNGENAWITWQELNGNLGAKVFDEKLIFSVN